MPILHLYLQVRKNILFHRTIPITSFILSVHSLQWLSKFGFFYPHPFRFHAALIFHLSTPSPIFSFSPISFIIIFLKGRNIKLFANRILYQGQNT